MSSGKVQVPRGAAVLILEQWKREAEELDCRLGSLFSSIKELEASLAESSKPAVQQVSSDNGGGVIPEPFKAPRGENLKKIAALFAANPGKAFSTKDVSLRVGIPITSTQAVLRKDKNGFRQTESGWVMEGQPLFPVAIQRPESKSTQ
jgi:hypothetical protein